MKPFFYSKDVRVGRLRTLVFILHIGTSFLFCRAPVLDFFFAIGLRPHIRPFPMVLYIVDKSATHSPHTHPLHAIWSYKKLDCGSLIGNRKLGERNGGTCLYDAASNWTRWVPRRVFFCWWLSILSWRFKTLHRFLLFSSAKSIGESFLVEVCILNRRTNTLQKST